MLVRRFAFVYYRNSTPVSIGQKDKHTHVSGQRRERDRRAEMPPWLWLNAANDGKVGRVRGKKDALGDQNDPSWSPEQSPFSQA